MVGKKVRVVSRAIGSDEAWAWESDGIDGYDIKPAERAEHGTDVIVYLKDDTADESFGTFASEHGLTQLIKRYSNYVRYPIKMEVTKSRKVEAPEPAEGDQPAAVTSEGGVSLAMVQVLKSQPGAEGLPDLHLVLEMNAKHPVFEALRAAHEAGDDDKVRTYAGILFDQALLVEGVMPDNPLAFAQAVSELMK